MGSCISAIGTANPGNRIAQRDILEYMIRSHGLEGGDARRLRSLYTRSGIDHRYSVLRDFDAENVPFSPLFFEDDRGWKKPGTAERQEKYRQHAVEVGTEAVKNCLSMETAAEITHLITVSCTGMYAPGLDIDLIEKLGLNRNTERICINFMGCYGAVNALKTADYICRAEASARVLIVSVELCTLHFQPDNTTDNWVANSLFSDGAAAVVVEPFSPGKNGLEIKTFYAEYIHDARDEMGWYIGDTGFNMQLTAEVPAQIGKHIAGLTQKLGVKTAPSDVPLRYAIHPGGKKILDVAEEALGFPAEMNDASRAVLREYGNMSSATILFVLEKLMRSGLDPGEQVAAFAFGPGLTVESMLLENHGENG
ncbi:MAG: type III polyketide synthase [Mucilaginibacter polytrichastri]|nr:type III polyketide synthase [Mucilaginibacter polytrichastri]